MDTQELVSYLDELLFSSSRPRYKIQTLEKKKEFSAEKNEQIYSELVASITKYQVPELSLYRISLFLFTEWTEVNEFKNFSAGLKTAFITNLLDVLYDCKMYKHITNCRVEKPTSQELILSPTNSSKSNLDFPINTIFENSDSLDIEEYDSSKELLSELEEKRVAVFTEYVDEVRRLLRRGVIESLKYSSEIVISDDELSIISLFCSVNNCVFVPVIAFEGFPFTLANWVLVKIVVGTVKLLV
jgi:hypothetical protein